ncbi:MAG: restriction endonuclease [Chloroflexota bacterium]|nr:restriction endonuclease [Chloroflexota bacterium]
MAVPTLNEFHRPVLGIADAATELLTRQRILDELALILNLTDDDLQERTGSGTLRMQNRAAWAMTDLKKANLLHNPKFNQWEITPAGRKYLSSHSGVITFQELQKLWPEAPTQITPPPITRPEADVLTPDEEMAQAHQRQQEQLMEELLENIGRVSPNTFEILVVALLEKMGYGKGNVVGRSGDGGIDGIITQDTLGLEKVYVQAKRYTSTQVGDVDIRNFSGSLSAKGATKGVFITTSAFTKKALEMANSISMGNQLIRLIDGRELAKLMLEYNVGVVPETTYIIKKLDANYFSED